MILIANKCDLTYERVVSKAEGQNFAKMHNITYMETSAKTDKNVNFAFENLSNNVFMSVDNKTVVADRDGTYGVKLGDYYEGSSRQNIGLGGGLDSHTFGKNLLKKKKEKAPEEKSSCCSN